MCVDVWVSVCLCFASDHSLLTTLSSEQSRRARVFVYLKKGRKYGFALSLCIVLAHSLVVFVDVSMSVCMCLGGNSKILSPVALTCYFFYNKIVRLISKLIVIVYSQFDTHTTL